MHTIEWWLYSHSTNLQTKHPGMARSSEYIDPPHMNMSCNTIAWCIKSVKHSCSKTFTKYSMNLESFGDCMTWTTDVWLSSTRKAPNESISVLCFAFSLNWCCWYGMYGDLNDTSTSWANVRHIVHRAQGPGLGTPILRHGREVLRWWPPFFKFSIRLGTYVIPQHIPIDSLFLQKKLVCLYHFWFQRY